MASPSEQKRGLRASARQGRAALATADAGERVAAAFLARVPVAAAAVVAAYWPLGEELDPRPLLHRLAERGHAIGLPIVRGIDEPLVFRQWQPDAPMQTSRWGIMVPAETAPEVVPDLVIVPVLAFDGAGFRLGYGGGYYDRTLAALKQSGKPVLTVGLAYAGQEVAALPHEAFDQRLDWVVTEREARTFA